MANEQKTDTESRRSSNQARDTGLQSRSQRSGVTRRDPGALWGQSPFASIFQRWNDEMDRMFDDFGFGRGRSLIGDQNVSAWSPQVEVFQRGNELVVRADLPGLTKDDVKVEIADDVLTIQGERKQEQEEEREGWYRNERSYGSFYRAVPLPEGTISDSAKASFKNGVLEIVLQAPPREVNRGRRLEIKEG
jgi:HSP20 family protein